MHTRTAQGHLRLVLAPIVYNAMAQKACLRALPLYRALRRVLRASTYDPLLHHPPAHTLPNVVGRCVQFYTPTLVRLVYPFISHELEPHIALDMHYGSILVHAAELTELKLLVCRTRLQLATY